ncbi:MAG: hypothetical protein MJ170_02450 [Alphaproteobacteria bacterium]|nr:hypothetical protein [Alphaproteobacteria bacterium]
MANTFINAIAKLRSAMGMQKHPEFDSDTNPALHWLQKAAEAKFDIEHFYEVEKTSPNKLNAEQTQKLKKLKRDLVKYKLRYTKALKKTDMKNAEKEVLKMAKKHQKNGVYNQVVFDKMLLCIQNKNFGNVL